MLQRNRTYTRLLLMVPVAICLMLLMPNRASAQACTQGACLSIGPDLADVDLAEAELLDALLSSLTNTDLDLDQLELDALTGGDLDLTALLEELRIDNGLTSLEDVLTAELTLNQMLDAASDVAQADGDIALQAALDGLRSALVGLDSNDTIQLGDLLDGDLSLNGLSNVQLNALDLVEGLIQLNNFENVETPLLDATLSGDSLGLDNLLDGLLEGVDVGDVRLMAQVTTPPSFVCGTVGAQFQSAGLRLVLDAELLGLSLGETELNALDQALEALGISGLADVEVGAELSNLLLFMDVGPTVGTISAIDPVSGDVTAEVAPGAVSVYLGNADKTVFFNRDDTLDVDVDLEAAPLGMLGITLTTGLPPVAAIETPLNFDIGAQAVASVNAGEPQTVVFSGGLPDTQTVVASPTFVEDLATDLLDDLSIELDGDLGLLDGLLDLDGIETLLDPVLDVNLPLDSLLSDLLDPILDGAGIGLGESDVTVSASVQLCNDLSITLSSSGNVENGGMGTFFVNVRNDGEAIATETITVGLTLPAELSFGSFSGANWTLESSTNGMLRFFNDSDVAAGGSLAELSVTVGADAQAAGSTVTTEAVVNTEGDASPDNNSASVETRIVLDLDRDEDGDGLPNGEENADPNGDGNPDDAQDSDDDGTPDFLDGDDDGDGVSNSEENADPNGDGNPDDAQDTDGNGLPDYLDSDDDGDGVFTREENADPNGDGNPDDAQDTDDNGTPDYLDPDDDGDSAPTDQENADPNGDGIPDDAQDTDDDGTPDYLDPDDDGDNVPTRTEEPDPNGDGNVNDARDTDKDGTPDYLDADDDNDNTPTSEEDDNGDGDPMNDDDNGDGVPDFRDPSNPREPRNPRNPSDGGNQSGSNDIMLPLVILNG